MSNVTGQSLNRGCLVIDEANNSVFLSYILTSGLFFMNQETSQSIILRLTTWLLTGWNEKLCSYWYPFCNLFIIIIVYQSLIIKLITYVFDNLLSKHAIQFLSAVSQMWGFASFLCLISQFETYLLLLIEKNFRPLMSKLFFQEANFRWSSTETVLLTM